MIVDYFNSKYILFKAETNASMIHSIDKKNNSTKILVHKHV